MYSTNTTNIQIKVNGWKEVYKNGDDFKIYSNGELTKVSVNISSYSFAKGGWTQIRSYDRSIPPHWFKTNDGNVTVRIGANGNKLEYYNISSGTISQSLFITYIF